MKRESIVPNSEEHWLSLRESNLNSTEISALFSDPETGLCVSPYETLYELWHRKAGQIPSSFESNERVLWGQRLENAIIAGAAEEKGWKIHKVNRYVQLPEYRLGSSFDAEVVNLPGRPLFEAKNVDGLRFKETWPVDENGNVGASLHIEIQLQHQLGVMGREKGYIGALIGGNRMTYIERDFNPEIFEAIKIKAVQFWTSVINGHPPEPSFPEDAALLCKIYSHVEKGKVIEAVGDRSYSQLALEYLEWSKQEKLAKEQKESIKAKLLMQMDGAAKVIGDGFSITTSISEVAQYTVGPLSKRNWRVTAKEKK
jgi:predicted phage-related endonuclease